MKKIIYILLITGFISGCAQTYNDRHYNSNNKLSNVKIEKYESKPFKKEPNKSAGWNFYQEADDYIFKCELIADAGYRLYQITQDSNVRDQYANNLTECTVDAMKHVLITYQDFKGSKTTKKIKDSGESFYKRWTSYIESMSTYSPKDEDLERDYKKALTDFRIDLK